MTLPSQPGTVAHAPPSRINIFSASGLDRAAELRREDAWLAERLRDPTTRFVPVSRTRVLVDGAAPPRAVLLSAEELGPRPDAGATVFLGREGGAAWFAVDLPEDAPAPAGRGEFVELRGIGALLDRREAGLLAYARGMLYWHRRHRFCGECGAPAASEQGGHVRVCTAAACGAQHFPRTDPAIIVRVTAGERCLLARQAAWPPGQYAVLAGFVEPGESLEDAVAREVHEETGIRTGAVRYHSSQPWPFPGSLMVGFTAEAASEEIRLDRTELEDARWMTREEVRAGVVRGELRLPSAVSIAYALVAEWLGGAAPA